MDYSYLVYSVFIDHGLEYIYIDDLINICQTNKKTYKRFNKPYILNRIQKHYDVTKCSSFNETVFYCNVSCWGVGCLNIVSIQKCVKLASKREDYRVLNEASIRGYENMNRIAEYAARYGRTVLLKDAISKGAFNTEDIVCSAALGGFMDIVNTYSNGKIYILDHLALGGHLAEMVKIIGPNINSLGFNQRRFLVRCAARSGNLELVKWLLGNITISYELIASSAARRGHYNIIEWAAEKDKTFSMSQVIIAAARNGNVTVMNKILKIKNPTELSKNMLLNFARAGKINLIKAFSVNRPFDGKVLKSICSNAAVKGYLDIVAWAVENGSSSTHIAFAAASGGHLHIIKWCERKGISTEYIADDAVENGHFDVLEWALGKGQKPSSSSLGISAEMNHLECLKLAYLYDNTLSIDTFLVIARTHGNIKIVDWCNSILLDQN